MPDVAANVIPDAVVEELDGLARGQVDVHALRRKLLLLIGEEQPAVEPEGFELPSG